MKGIDKPYNYNGILNLTLVAAPVALMHFKGIQRASLSTVLALAGTVAITRQISNYLEDTLVYTTPQDAIEENDGKNQVKHENLNGFFSKARHYALRFANEFTLETPGSVAFVGVYTALSNAKIFSNLNLAPGSCYPAVSLAYLMSGLFDNSLSKTLTNQNSEGEQLNLNWSNFLVSLELTVFFGLAARLPNKSYAGVFASAAAAGYLTNLIGYTACKVAGDDAAAKELRSVKSILNWTFIRGVKSSLYAIPGNFSFVQEVLITNLYESSCTVVNEIINQEFLNKKCEEIIGYATLPHDYIDSGLKAVGLSK